MGYGLHPRRGGLLERGVNQRLQLLLEHVVVGRRVPQVVHQGGLPVHGSAEHQPGEEPYINTDSQNKEQVGITAP